MQPIKKAGIALVVIAMVFMFSPGLAEAIHSGSSDTTPPTPVSFSYDRMEGYNLIFTWTKNMDSDFKYYKLAKSETNPNPSYPDEYAGWVSSDRDRISLRIPYESISMKKGHTYYVAMSVRDSSGNVGTSNVVQVSIPEDAPSKYDGKSSSKKDKDPVIAGNSNMAYNSKFRGGVNVAVADFNGDGNKEVVTGAGRGGGPQVRIFDKKNNLQAQFMAFHPDSRYGVNVAAGDVDGDGKDELIVAPAGYDQGLIKVFDIDLGSYGFGDETYSIIGYWNAFGSARVGATVAAGDIDGDGMDEVICGTGTNGGPQVRVYEPRGRLNQSFFAFSKEQRTGVYVASGEDLDNDGRDEIIAAEGPGKGTAVKIISGRTRKTQKSFSAFAHGVNSGSHPALADINGDGTAEVLVGAGHGGGPQVLAYNSAGQRSSVNFFAYDSDFRGGVNVAAGQVTAGGKVEVVTGAGFGGGPNVRVITAY